MAVVGVGAAPTANASWPPHAASWPVGQSIVDCQFSCVVAQPHAQSASSSAPADERTGSEHSCDAASTPLGRSAVNDGEGAVAAARAQAVGVTI